jgi:hypothetical protein
VLITIDMAFESNTFKVIVHLDGIAMEAKADPSLHATCI